MEKYKLIKDCFAAYSYVFIIVFAFFVSLPLAYSEEGHAKSSEHLIWLQPREPFEVRNGRIIYLEHCAPCHGDTGKGNGKYYASDLDPKPRDFNDPKFMNSLKDEYLIEVIRKGTAAFGMSSYCPPWGATLKEDEKIKNIIAFLRTLTSK